MVTTKCTRVKSVQEKTCSETPDVLTSDTEDGENLGGEVKNISTRDSVHEIF